MSTSWFWLGFRYSNFFEFEVLDDEELHETLSSVSVTLLSVTSMLGSFLIVPWTYNSWSVWVTLTTSTSLSFSVLVYSFSLVVLAISLLFVSVTPVRLYIEKWDIGKNKDVFQLELLSMECIYHYTKRHSWWDLLFEIMVEIHFQKIEIW